MKETRSQILLAAICLLLGIMVVTQFRSQRSTRDVPQSGTDQATYISQLYESNTALEQQANELSDELAQYHQSDSSGKSNLDTMVKDLQTLRMATGQVDVTGPGVVVTVKGELTVFELQDLVNELRNASAESIAVNGIRVVTRSAITVDDNGQITIDKQAVSNPYKLEAIGEPDTLLHALQRKGGLIALLQAQHADLDIQVAERPTQDQTGWLKLPKSAVDFSNVYGQAVPAATQEPATP